MVIEIIYRMLVYIMSVYRMSVYRMLIYRISGVRNVKVPLFFFIHLKILFTRKVFKMFNLPERNYY